MLLLSLGLLPLAEETTTGALLLLPFTIKVQGQDFGRGQSLFTDHKAHAVGDIITVEPGIYMPGKLGVRIEDDILVTETDHKILTVDKKYALLLLCLEDKRHEKSRYSNYRQKKYVGTRYK